MSKIHTSNVYNVLEDVRFYLHNHDWYHNQTRVCIWDHRPTPAVKESVRQDISAFYWTMTTTV